MPQRFVTVYVCSTCRNETDDPTKVAQYRVTGPGRALDYDLCTSCAESDWFARFIDAGTPALRSQGRQVKSSLPQAAGKIKPTDTGEVPCSQCERTFDSAHGLAMHRTAVHGTISVTAAREAQRGQGEHRCDQCDYGAQNAQGLGAHKRSKHGVIGPKSRPAKR